MTRDELYESDRGERKYYYSKSDLKNKVKLPLTKDGCEAILEIVTKALDLPLDDTIRQVFAGFVHHTDQSINSTSLDEVGRLIFNHFSKNATWKLDQEAKERIRGEAEAKKALTVVKESAPESIKEQDAVQ